MISEPVKMPVSVLALLAGIFGLCIGSFLNVVIHRVPRGESIVRPPSACPRCRQPIRFYDNIPLLSYLWLRGRCRHCRAPIAARYPLVELLTALAAVAAVAKFGPTPSALVHFIFLACLLAVTFIDLDHRIIPDAISLPGIIFFGLAAPLFTGISWRQSVAGIVAGGGILFLVAWIYRAITGKTGMGGGDIKLLAMIGALTGVQGVLFTIFVSSVLGVAAGSLAMIRQRKGLKLAIPYGPFLAAGAAVFIFCGVRLIAWYLRLVR